jgi:hypothetical protein
LVPEGRLADEEFVNEDAEGPPVNGGTVSGVADNFRCEVFRGAAERICLSCDCESRVTWLAIILCGATIFENR